jgi:WD40 repeat protein
MTQNQPTKARKPQGRRPGGRRTIVFLAVVTLSLVAGPVFVFVVVPALARGVSGPDDWQAELVLGHPDTMIFDAAFSPDGGRLLTCSAADLRVWDSRAGRPLLTLPGGAGLRGAWSPDGGRILGWGGGEGARRPGPQAERSLGGVVCWDAATGEWLLDAARGAVSACRPDFSPDGRLFVTAGPENAARIWNAADGALLRALGGHAAEVVAARFSPDGRRVATLGRGPGAEGTGRSGDDPTWRVWDVATGDCVLTADSEASGGTAHAPTDLLWTPDGTRLVVWGRQSPALVFDAASGRRLATLERPPFRTTSVTCSPDGGLMATTTTGPLLVWDARTFEVKASLGGDEDGPALLAEFSADGRWLYGVGDRAAVGGRRTEVRVWETRTFTRRGPIASWRSRLRRARFSPDGRRIVTVGTEGATIWSRAEPDGE